MKFVSRYFKRKVLELTKSTVILRKLEHETSTRKLHCIRVWNHKNPEGIYYIYCLIGTKDDNTIVTLGYYEKSINKWISIKD